MKRIIFDTDIGIDCDDAVALAVLLKYDADGIIRLEAIGASTEREGATANIAAICRDFGRDVPIARLHGANLECDKINTYSKDVMDRYGLKDSEADLVPLYRRVLAEAKEKITIIAVGPLASIKQLFESGKDEYSELDGIELVAQKAEALYIMGGIFMDNNLIYGKPADYKTTEWNIRQDIGAAQFVAKNSPIPTIWCPFEAGDKVFSYASDADTATNYSLRVWCKKNRVPEGAPIRRSSWDPITCLTAIDDVSKFFDMSDFGTVEVNDAAETTFKRGDGQHRILILKEGFEGVSDMINKTLREAESIQK